MNIRHALAALLLALALPPLTANASAPADSLKAQADSAYAADDFKTAAKLYQQAPHTASVCYNLGNCYYRLDDMAHALLWYERAYMLDPGDSDIRFNLSMARGKTIDKVTPRHQLFFVNWWASLVNMASADEWGRTAIALFALALLSLALCIALRPLRAKKTALTAFSLLLLLAVLGNVCALSQRAKLTQRSAAIVMAPSAVVKSTPSASGSDLFVLHEGTRVDITDSTLKDWRQIKLADGKVGWIELRLIEAI